MICADCEGSGWLGPVESDGQAAPDAEPCPRCGGRGYFGRDEFGNWDGCELCEGTGIHPDDPAFPH